MCVNVTQIYLQFMTYIKLVARDMHALIFHLMRLMNIPICPVGLLRCPKKYCVYQGLMTRSKFKLYMHALLSSTRRSRNIRIKSIHDIYS